MIPIILVMFFVQAVLDGKNYNIGYFSIAIIISAVIIYIITNINYKTTYNETYKESANLRIEIANILKSLPLSYFSKHDISDLSQTVMSDVAAIEHCISSCNRSLYRI